VKLDTVELQMMRRSRGSHLGCRGFERAAAWAGGSGWLLCSKAASGGATRWFSDQGKGQNGAIVVQRCSSSKWWGVGGVPIGEAMVRVDTRVSWPNSKKL
jgi:hypothetical protein